MVDQPVQHREVLAQQAEELEIGLSAFAAMTKDAGSLLARLDKHLGKLNKVNSPIFEQAATLTWAEQNIVAAKAATDQLLVHLGTARKVEPALRGGPGRDLTGYMALLTQLEGAMAALEASYTLPVAQEAYTYAAKVQSRALQDCASDLVAVLTQQSNASLPSVSVLVQSCEGQSLQSIMTKPRMPEFNDKALARLQALAALLKADPNSSATSSYAQVRSLALASVLRGAGTVPSGAKASAAVLSQEQAEKAASSWSRQLRLIAIVSSSEVALATAIWGKDLAPHVVGEVVQQSLVNLVQQGRELTKGRMQPAKVFMLLEMLKNMEEVLPLLEGLLGDSLAVEGLTEPLRDLSNALATTARELFAAFESSIPRDSSKAQVVDGTVHPLTASTLGFMRRLFTYGATSQVLFVERNQGGGAMAELSQQVAARRMREAVERCMQGLLQALEVKAKAYKVKALASIFLMNNVHYMVASAEQSDALGVLGKAWVENHKDIIERHGQEYHEQVWMPLVRALRAVESQEDPEPKDESKWKEWVKRHFKIFNQVVEKVCVEQSGWSIHDPRLRQAVCRVILQDLLPPYQYFWDTYSQADFTSTRNKYVRCSPDDMEKLISNDLFRGRPMTVALARGAHKPGATGTLDRGNLLPTVSEPSAVSVVQPRSKTPGRTPSTAPSVAASTRSRLSG